MRNLFSFFLLLVTCLALTACGITLEGAGQDLESWGKTIQDTF